MHWAPIPIVEFALPPASDVAISDEDVFRLISRGPWRGGNLSAAALIGFLAVSVVAFLTGNVIVGLIFCTLGVAAGTAHILSRHAINLALWIVREPAAVYWAEPRQFVQQLLFYRRTVTSLAFHTPAPVRLEPVLAQEELVLVLSWLRQRHPDALIGSFSPDDSDGRLSGNDPWSPTSMTSGTRMGTGS